MAYISYADFTASCQLGECVRQRHSEFETKGKKIFVDLQIILKREDVIARLPLKRAKESLIIGVFDRG